LPPSISCRAVIVVFTLSALFVLTVLVCAKNVLGFLDCQLF
jgi:hypothetical protein